VPVNNARWDLYLPPDYDYTAFKGSMAHQAETTPIVQAYSLAEYRVQEAEKMANRKAAYKSAVSNAQKQLNSGDLKNFNNSFNQIEADNGYFADETTKREVSSLKENFGRIQGQNLQNQVHKGTQKSLQYPAADGEAAQQQWFKLQQAQQLGVTRVQPLRINLPTRGIHHAFVQVLQTDLKKPLTIELKAGNASKMNWFSCLLGCAAGFVVLLGVAWVLIRQFGAYRKKD
jgi:hypothetical protein